MNTSVKILCLKCFQVSEENHEENNYVVAEEEEDLLESVDAKVSHLV